MLRLFQSLNSLLSLLLMLPYIAIGLFILYFYMGDTLFTLIKVGFVLFVVSFVIAIISVFRAILSVKGLLKINRLIRIVQIGDRYFVSIRNKELKSKLNIPEKGVYWHLLSGGEQDKTPKWKKSDISKLNACKRFKSSSIEDLERYLDTLPFKIGTKRIIKEYLSSKKNKKAKANNRKKNFNYNQFRYRRIRANSAPIMRNQLNTLKETKP